MSDETILPFTRAAELVDDGCEPGWLFEGLWGEAAVGLIGGAPKCCKSWLGLEMATSLASGRPCLGIYAVDEPGTTLLFMAEDAAPIVKQRLLALCRARQLDLATLPIYVITADALRLDGASDQRRLRQTLDRVRPRMLLLDPLVRLHRIDENSAGEVSGLLAYFREIQRAFDTAVVLVHHSRKNSPSGQPGQALRGSSDLHAFGDSNLYLRRAGEELWLTFEHRAAQAPEPVQIRLVDEPEPHLEVVGHAPGAVATEPIDDRVIATLARHGALTRTQLRDLLAIRNAALGESLTRLQAQQRIARDRTGFIAIAPDRSRSAP